eukprot:5241882-Pleurochrysis_carterae.AAC.1
MYVAPLKGSARLLADLHGRERAVRALRLLLVLGRVCGQAREELGREQVEEHLRVGAGVEMAVLPQQVVLQLGQADQVAVVREGDAVRRVNEEGLRLGARRRAGGGVAHVANAHRTAQVAQLLGLEDVTRHAIVLVQAEPA